VLKKSWIITFWIVAVVFGILLSAANLYLGDLNQDEGWYLYAAGQVAKGQLPYRDFAFTQTPLLPLVYSLLWPVVEMFGVAGGRLITAIFGLLAAGIAAWTAGRLSPKRWRHVAAVLAFILIVLNVYQSYFSTIVKTYSLCAFFLSAGVLLLTWAKAGKGEWACFGAGLLTAAAAGTRLSAGAAMPVIFLYLVVFRKQLGWKRWFMYGLGGGLGLLFIFLPLYLLSPDGVTFWLVEYHKLRDPGTGLYQMVLKAGFVSRYVQAYFVQSCLALALFVSYLVWFPRRNKETDPEEERVKSDEKLLPCPVVIPWAVWGGITLLHLSAPFPYDDYQVIVYPLFGAALAVSLVYRLNVLNKACDEHTSSQRVLWIIATLLFCTITSSFSSPINQNWMIRGRDRIWWLMKEKPDMVVLREVGAWLKARTRPGDILLTQDTYIAVEANRSVPQGLELGPFSYYPAMDTEKAKRLHVLNEDLLLDLLQSSRAPYAAISGYGLSIECPAVERLEQNETDLLWDTMQKHYQTVRTIPAFGQAHTTLRILKRKVAAGEEEL